MNAIIKKLFSHIVNPFFKLVPVKKNQIVFQCGRGMYDENPKAIYNYIKDQKDNEFKLVWILDKNVVDTNIPKNEICYSGTIKSLFVLASSKYWIRSESIGSPIKKKKNQIYIQAWHGHGVFKKMGNDKIKTNERKQLEHTKEWDFLICESEPSKKIMLSSTLYKGETLVLGYSSTDNLIAKKNDEQYKRALKKKLGINNKKETILYAPTYRDWLTNKSDISLPILSLKQLNDQYNIIFRVHPILRNKIDPNFLEKASFIDCNNYPNMEDLLLITDILITDYSSTFCEYALLEKPIIFYAFDFKKYELENGFYINYKTDLPGIIAYTEEELFRIIKEKKYEKNYKKKLDEFNKKYNYLNDRNAAKRFYEILKRGGFDKDV